MSVAASINILLKANTSEVESKLAAVEKQFHHLMSVLESGGGFIGHELRNIFEKTFSPEALKGLFEEIIHLGHVAERLDIIPEKLAGLRLAADFTGQSFESITTALQKMLVAVSGSGDPLKKAASDKAFNQLKLSAESIKDLSPDQMFMRIADAMEHVENVADRVNIAKAIFGKGGVPILNMIEDGSKGLEKFQRIAEFAGTTINAIDGKKFKELNALLKVMWEVLRGVTLAVLEHLIPVFKMLAVIGIVIGKAMSAVFSRFGDVIIRLIEIMVAYRAITWSVVAAERAWATVSAIGAAIRAGGWAGIGKVIGGIAAAGGVVFMLNKAFNELERTLKDFDQSMPGLKGTEDLEENMPDFTGKGVLPKHPAAFIKDTVEAYSAIINAGGNPMKDVAKNTKRSADSLDIIKKLRPQALAPANLMGAAR